MVDVLVGDVPNDVSVVMDEMVVMVVVVVVDVMMDVVVDVVMVISDPAGLTLDTPGGSGSCRILNDQNFIGIY